MPSETVRIVIDAQVDADEISGHIGDGTADPKPFLGWLGLLGALDRLLGVRRSSGAEPVTRVCVAFDSAERAEAFTASPKLGDAILDAGSEGRPEIWFTHPLRDRSDS